MGRDIERRVRTLEEGTPRGYASFDAKGKPAVQSDLPALKWFTSALRLLQSNGHDSEKNALRAQLRRSEGPDNGGGFLYQVLEAADVPPDVKEKKR